MMLHHTNSHPTQALKRARSAQWRHDDDGAAEIGHRYVAYIVVAAAAVAGPIEVAALRAGCVTAYATYRAERIAQPRRTARFLGKSSFRSTSVSFAMPQEVSR